VKAQRWRQMMQEDDDTGSLRPRRDIAASEPDRAEQR